MYGGTPTFSQIGLWDPVFKILVRALGDTCRSCSCVLVPEQDKGPMQHGMELEPIHKDHILGTATLKPLQTVWTQIRPDILSRPYRGTDCLTL